jgi:suppressor for copper-sensitivity B
MNNLWTTRRILSASSCILTVMLVAAIGLLPTSTFAQKGKVGEGFGSFGLPQANFGAPNLSNMSVTATYELETGSRKGRLIVVGVIADGWHAYSHTQLPGGPKATSIKIKSDFVKLTGALAADQEPEVKQLEEFPGVPIEELHGTVTWTAPFELTRDIDSATTNIDLVFDGQVCQTGGSCIPVNEKLSAKFAGNYGNAQKNTTLRADKTHGTWSASLSHSQIKPGQSGKLVLRFEPDKGYHVYPFIQDEKSTDFRTLIVATQRSGLKFGAPVTNAERESVDAGLEKPVEYHTGVVEWTIPIQVPPTTPPGECPIELKVGFLTCNETSCDPPNGVTFNGTLLVDNQPEEKTVAMSATQTPFSKVADTPNLVGWISRGDSTAAGAATIPLNLWHILAALAGGFILNFMPCVLPVVGLKLLSFVNQAGTSRTRVITLNLAFVAGILAVMMILAAVTIIAKLWYSQAFGWGQQFERLDFQVGLAVLMFAMALSFLGVWEIPIPGFATGSASSGLMSKEGHTGAFLKGILTTVLATPCSGPFLGAIFGITLSLEPISIVILYMTLGIGLGLPYLGLCLYPGLVKLLPRPGAWMDTLKQVLAFPLLLTVVYLVQIVNPDYRIATLILLIVVWFACWLIGQVPSYADINQVRRGWMIASAVIALGAVVSFSFFGPIKHYLNWEPYNAAQLAEYQRQGKTVMIEFTARWCATCQTNMRFAIDRPAVGELCEKRDIITMLADKSEPSPHIDQKLQELGSNSIPLVAIIRPDAEPILLRDLITQSTLLAALDEASSGKKNSESAIMSTNDMPPGQPNVATKPVSLQSK